MSSTFTERISFIQKNFGKGVLSRDGNDITVTCPECNESSKKKLAINLETWKFHCWVCSARGNTIVPLLRKHSPRDVVDYFRSYYLNDKILSADIAPLENEIVSLPDGFVPLASRPGKLSPDDKAVLRYLKSRGLTDRDLWKYRIGTTHSGKFSRRAIFASLDQGGDVNYFVSRSVDSNSRFRYLNATTDKTSIVFNDIDIDWDKTIYLVEGIFDLVSLKENGTCLLGSSLTERSLLFKKIVANHSSVVLCLDNDMKNKIGKIADLLTSYDCEVSIMDTSAAKDIAEMTQSQLDAAKSSTQKWSMTASFHYKIANIKSGSMLI